MSDLDTIYIMSKGRPWSYTATYLEKIDYTGDWYIVCGDNDETVPEYRDRWGSERILVFDHAEYWAKTDMMDAYGTSKSSGAAPARNAICDISRARGEHRHWQFDDDLALFGEKHLIAGKTFGAVSSTPIDAGDVLFDRLHVLSSFADRVHIPVLGIGHKSDSGKIHGRASSPLDSKGRLRLSRSSVIALSISSIEGDVLPWSSRLYDDIAHSLAQMRIGRYDYSLSNLYFEEGVSWGMLQKREKVKKDASGGLMDLYFSNSVEDGFCRDLSVCTMQYPNAVRIVTKGGAPFSNRWFKCKFWSSSSFLPVVLREEYRK